MTTRRQHLKSRAVTLPPPGWFNCPMAPTAETSPAPGPSGAAEAVPDERVDGVMDALREVIDPCCKEKGISVVDMGLVQDVQVTGRDVRIELTLTSGWCPFAVDLVGMVQEAAETVLGVDRAAVDLAWDEAWGTHRLSENARRKLRFLPEPKQVADRDTYVTLHLPTQQRTGAPTDDR
jgi:metal-sulfur cluster biosynthetic enzyme